MNMRHFLPVQRRERVKAKTIVLALGAAGLLAISAVLGMATPASAAATVTRGTITTPIFETGLTDDCRAGLTGTLVGTDVFDFQDVETAEGFHFNATQGDSGRIDWSDGTYAIIESVDRISFNAVGHGTTVLTTTHVDSVDTYTADGVFLFRGTLHEVERLTVTDGVVRVEFERGRFHFFGGC